MSGLEHCRVVLVRPQFAGNVGATARVMRNFGMRSLVLVDPVADVHDRQARQLSTHGEHLLDEARTVAELGEAVGDCVLAVATSARKGGLFRRQSVVSPEEAATRLVQVLPDGPAALVFGPERTGLTDAEVTRCHCQVHVPSDPAYPALNLAQAVAICLYEVRRAWLRQSDTPVSLPEPPAPLAEQERALGHLKEALEAIHFLYGEKAEALMHGLRHLLGRAGPTAMELGLLHGLARQIQWHVDHHGETSPERQRRGPVADAPGSL